MQRLLDKYPFFCRMSFGPLIKAIRASAARAGQDSACRSKEIDSFLEAAEALPDLMQDAELTEEHKRSAAGLLRLAFSPTAMETEAVAAFSPFSRRPVFATDAFRRLFIAEDGTLQGRMTMSDERFDRGLAIRAYLFILDRFYGIRQHLQYPLVRIVEDPESGLERHYRIDPDYRFVEALTVGEAPLLGETEKEWVLDHLTDPEALREVLPPERFGLQGLTVFKAADATEAEMIGALSRDLIDQESIVSAEGFDRLQHHLRVLFHRPALTAGIAALEQNQILLLNSGTDKSGDCIFAGSRHASLSLFSGSPFERAVDSGHIVRVADVEKDPWFQKDPGKAAPEGIRSLMIAPLSYKGRVIGTLDVGSPKTGDLCPMDTVLMSQIQPLFAMAVNKALDDFHSQFQKVIKEKCTPIHPVVEWRFEQAALDHLEALRTDENAQMAPIVFKEVFPIYGISDVRGSAAERNRAISEDLSAQLALALKVVKEAGTVRPLMIFRELEKRIQGQMKRLKAGLGSDDEATVLTFLRSEVEAHFPELKTAAGLARLAEAMEPELKVPLKTAHLVLIQEAPLSIRFRYDERRFDVDGAYDVRNEIIKSRIDKARVKGTQERLTQPGKIAVVYTSSAEAREMHQHIEFLIEEKELTGRPEFLDLEDLPGVQGLKALRVEVDMQNAAQAAPDVAGKAR